MMFYTSQSSIPLKRQCHDQKMGIFSQCQRKYIKWKYIFGSKAFTSIGNIVLSIFVVFMMAFIFSTQLKQNIYVDKNLSNIYENNNVIKKIRTSEKNSTKEKVYKTINNWQLSYAHNNVEVLPVLSPLRDSQWTKYKSNQLIKWTEKPFNFIHERLKELDSENRKEYGYDSLDNVSAGDLGAPVELKGHLKEESYVKFSEHQINVVASDIMSLNRRLQDVRPHK